MAKDLAKEIASRLREIIGNRQIVDIEGGPRASYIYRLLKRANPSIQALDAIVRQYGSSLPEFFDAFRGDAQEERLRLSEEARIHLESILASDANLMAFVEVLRNFDAAFAPRTSSKSFGHKKK